MIFNNYNYTIFFILFYFIIIEQAYTQEYIFVGNPQSVLEAGTYKQNYNTGMYYYHKRQWNLAIEFFNRCSELTRKRVKHFTPLTWSYIYEGEYSEAIKSISNLNNKKEKLLIRLVLKEATSKGKKNKLSKNVVDRIINDKKDIIKRTKANLIALSKNEIIDYGP